MVISHDGYHSAVAIDLDQLSYIDAGRQEKMVCHMIENAAIDLFRYPYREIMDKHFHEED